MQDKLKTARFGTTLFLDNPLHRQAWEILSAVPAGQRTNWLCLALCQQAQREQFLRDMETSIRKELQSSFDSTNTPQPQKTESVNDDVLGFLRALQEEGDKSRTNDRYFDMFAGIGGFRAGLDRAGGFQCVGHCEIDKYADASYRATHDIRKEEVYHADARSINPEQLPDFDLLCGGFPCQAFSMAGKRQGFADARGTLFFELARVVKEKRPAYLFLENVPGLLSHDGGRTFAVILSTLYDMGYHVEWAVLNSKHFRVPQSRRRLFLIGYLDQRCAGKILPVFGAGTEAPVRVIERSQDSGDCDTKGVACTQTSNSGETRSKTDLCFIDLTKGDPKITATARCLNTRQDGSPTNFKGQNSGVLYIKEATKKGFKEAREGDSIDLGFAGSNTRRGRVGQNVAHTLQTGCIQGIVEHSGRIRRLMPRECFRLQGFSEEQIDKILAINSDAQAYKQAGNGVTVTVIEAIGRKIREVDTMLHRSGSSAA